MTIVRLGSKRALPRIMNNFALVSLGIPSLDVDFLNPSDTLPSIFTFSRNSVATITNSSGALVSKAINTPRFDYHPVTLKPRGLRREESRENKFLNSTIGGANLATQNITVTAVPWTVSFYGTGTITFSGAYAGAPLVGSGAYPTRSSVTFTPSAGTLTCTVTGTVQYAQAELGGFVTSYIPTAGASVVREADVIEITGSNFSSWYNATEGTFIIKSEETYPSQTAPGAANSILFRVDDGTVNNRMGLAAFDGLRYAVSATSGGDFFAFTIGSSLIVNETPQTSALTYQNDNATGAFKGFVATPDTTFDTPTVDRFRFGVSPALNLTSNFNGHYSRLTYYNTRLSESLLGILTT